MYNKAYFAQHLKALLDKRGINQNTLAEQLQTTEATISRYVNGVRTPNIETAVEISRVLNVSMDELCGVQTPAQARQAPDVGILVNCYEKASDADRQVLWSLLDRYMTPEQRIIITAVLSDEKESAV